jgi:DNA-3-methyladenine glycosylase
VRDDGTGRRAGRIVEVEAYLGSDDRASHARFGETGRNRVMFGPAGRAYVYLVYGMYDCLNVVTEPAGVPAAVLVRAVEPLEGIAAMRVDRVLRATTRRRSLTPDRAAAAADRLARLPVARLASGPGLVAAAFGLDTGWTGMDMCDPASPLRLETAPATEPEPAIVATARIGVAYAGEPWSARPWRFVERGHPSVSGPVVPAG